MHNSRGNKDVDFEINLLPVLSVLSICICFLLTTTVWNRMGYLEINQAIGDQLPTSGKNPDSIIIKLLKNGNLDLEWRTDENSSAALQKTILATHSGTFLFNEKLKIELLHFIKNATQKASSLKTVLVLPEVGVPYGETIHMIDELKKLSLDIGLGPAVEGLALGGRS